MSVNFISEGKLSHKLGLSDSNIMDVNDDSGLNYFDDDVPFLDEDINDVRSTPDSCYSELSDGLASLLGILWQYCNY